MRAAASRMDLSVTISIENYLASEALPQTFKGVRCKPPILTRSPENIGTNLAQILWEATHYAERDAKSASFRMAR